MHIIVLGFEGSKYLFQLLFRSLCNLFFLAGRISLLIPKDSENNLLHNAHFSFVLGTSLRIPQRPMLDMFQAASYIYFCLKLARNTCALAWPGLGRTWLPCKLQVLQIAFKKEMNSVQSYCFPCKLQVQQNP